jgi:hypothetical protein
VQLIGDGTVYNHEGLERAALKHPSHTTFHKTPVSAADEEAGIRRFYRWHIDAALYELNPPRVTTLYAILVPQGSQQSAATTTARATSCPSRSAQPRSSRARPCSTICPARSRALQSSLGCATRRTRRRTQHGPRDREREQRAPFERAPAVDGG